MGIPFNIEHRAIIHDNKLGFHWRYDQRQPQVADRALRLGKEVRFDLVHYATLATYWVRAGVAAVPKPLVWGPVGGGMDPLSAC